MHDSDLPEDVRARVGRITALAAEAQATAGEEAGGEAAFALRETLSRYLPETLQAFRDVPPRLRELPDAEGRTPAERLAEQLEILERAVGARLAQAGEHARADLAVNGRFLEERFGPLASLPEAPQANLAASASPLAEDPHALARRLLASIPLDGRDGNGALLASLAGRLETVLPGLVRTRRAGLFDKRVVAIVADVPAGAALVRYTLDVDRAGGILAACGPVSGGVALRAERVDLETWTQALLEHVAIYAQSNRATHAALAAFFE